MANETLGHLKWLFPRLEVNAGFGHSGQKELYGISYKGIITHSDLEKLNHCNLEISHIQKSYSDDVLIAVVYLRI